MFKFFLKKNFADGWDNLFFLILMNAFSILLVLAVWFLFPIFSKIHPALPTLSLIAFSSILATLIFAYGAVSAKIANFDAGEISIFFRAFLYVWKISIPFGALLSILVLFVRFGIIYYLSLGGVIGTIAVGLLGWFMLIVSISLQWFVPLYFLQRGNNFKKCLKKSFIIFFDNPAFSFGVFLYNIVLFAFSCALFLIAPGFAGVTLSSTNALRLRLYKYDWLEENPELQNDRDKRADVPWDELLAEDKETLGPRKLSSFIFPWK